jgi:hypothetical protein
LAHAIFESAPRFALRLVNFFFSRRAVRCARSFFFRCAAPCAALDRFFCGAPRRALRLIVFFAVRRAVRCAFQYNLSSVALRSRNNKIKVNLIVDNFNFHAT